MTVPPTAPDASPPAPAGSALAAPVRVLILTYSYSGQSSVLVRRLAAGLSEQGVEVRQERLQPLKPLRFPMGTISKTLSLMLITLFRVRFAIQPLKLSQATPADLVILAGPTWSWNPSGPILALLDQYPELFHNRPVLVLISCRGYWASHWRYLNRRLRRMAAIPCGPLVFDHPQNEPWRTIGVFLKIAGIAPERASSSCFSHFYRRFGHTREQFTESYNLGRELATRLKAGEIPPKITRIPS